MVSAEVEVEMAISPVVNKKLHYSWIIILVTFFTILMAAGVRAMLAVVMEPLESYFGWSRILISFALAVNLFVYGLCGPFAAAFMELYGVRCIMNSALLLLAIGSGFSIFMNESWQMVVLLGFAFGTGIGFLSTVLGAIIATRWFVKYKGVVTGIFSASGAAGQLIFLPLFSMMLETNTWQSIFIFIFFSTFFTMVIVSITMRNRPSDIGLLPYGALEATPADTEINEKPFPLVFNGLKIAVYSKDFWLLSSSFFVCGATTVGLISSHFVPACNDQGISGMMAAGLLSTAGVFNICGTTLSGWLSDKFDNRWLLFWYYILRGLSLIFLPYALASKNIMLLILMIFYGLDWVATVPPTIRLSTELFGSKGSIIFGWIMVIHQIGAALAALGSGLLYALMGSYHCSFISGGICCAIAAGLVLNIGSRSTSVTRNF